MAPTPKWGSARSRGSLRPRSAIHDEVCLARAAGLTVRTLHYHEEIGLLHPSGRTAAGHRQYSGADVERLYRISLLRRLGLPLADIARALDEPAWSLRSALGATSKSSTAASRRWGDSGPAAAVYHAGLLLVTAGGLLRASSVDGRDYSAVIGIGTVLLLAIALSNSWQLVLSHDPETDERES